MSKGYIILYLLKYIAKWMFKNGTLICLANSYVWNYHFHQTLQEDIFQLLKTIFNFLSVNGHFFHKNLLWVYNAFDLET